MIQAQELRIGNLINLVSFENDVMEINIMASDIELCDESENEFNVHYKPIPITEKLLLKFGFENMEKFPLRYVQRVKPDSLSEFEPCIVCGDLWLTGIRHVHQLQNLYFSLTGEELTLSDVI